MKMSENRGPPNHPILIGLSMINHPFWWFSPYFWINTYMKMHDIKVKGICLAMESMAIFTRLEPVKGVLLG